MRPTLLLMGLALAASLGCGQTRLNMVKDSGRGPAPTSPPTAEQLVSYLNDNAGRIQSLRADEVWLTVSAEGGGADLSAKILVQKPRGFRLSAKSMGNQVVDLGSNDQEFWYWLSKSPQPYQFFCSYKDLADGRVRQMPFPFQPEWIIETLGLGPYGPAERLQLETDPQSLKLVERTRSPQGTPVRKVIVCRSRPVAAPQPQVTAYLLLDDATGKEICSAHITEVQVDRVTGGVLPKKIELRWPEAKIKLGMKLDGLAVNPPLPPAAFIRQKMNGVQAYDLARGLVAEGSLQQLKGRNR